jgi:hypothetical protein
MTVPTYIILGIVVGSNQGAVQRLQKCSTEISVECDKSIAVEPTPRR